MNTHFKYTFSIIVFNGEEFLRQVIDSIYDFAHQIIIIEGPDKNSLSFADVNGHSADGTLDIIRSYDDIHNKITLVQGTWRDKVHQCNAGIVHATGDYIWQIDDDEVYRQEDLLTIDNMLAERPDTTAVSVHWRNFFGGFDRVLPVTDTVDEVWRIFRLSPDCRWINHRPPDIADQQGRSMRTLRPLHAEELAAKGIYCYHFSYVTDRQIRAKMRYMNCMRMREYDHGMHAHPQWWRFLQLQQAAQRNLLLRPMVGAARRYFDWWKCRPANIEKRMTIDKGWNYDYYESVWKPWHKDRHAVEGNGTLLPTVGTSSSTVALADVGGTLPDALRSHPLAETYFSDNNYPMSDNNQGVANEQPMETTIA